MLQITFENKNNVTRQHGLKGKGVVSTTTLITWSGFNSHLGVDTVLRLWIRHFTMIILACCLRKTRKFRERKFEEIHRNIGLLETLINRCGLLQIKVYYRKKKFADHPILNAVWRQENKQALQHHYTANLNDHYNYYTAIKCCIISLKRSKNTTRQDRRANTFKSPWCSHTKSAW